MLALTLHRDTNRIRIGEDIVIYLADTSDVAKARVCVDAPRHIHIGREDYVDGQWVRSDRVPKARWPATDAGTK